MTQAPSNTSVPRPGRRLSKTALTLWLIAPLVVFAILYITINRQGPKEERARLAAERAKAGQKETKPMVH